MLRKETSHPLSYYSKSFLEKSTQPFVCLIRGCSGVGKTTTARALSHLNPPSIHIIADDLHSWITDHHICREHIELSVKAAGAVARVFIAAKHNVYIDFVFVEVWETDLLLAELLHNTPVFLVSLTADLNTIQQRDGGRAPEDIMGPRIGELYEELKASDETRGFVIDTSVLSPEQVIESIHEAIASGKAALPLNLGY